MGSGAQGRLPAISNVMEPSDYAAFPSFDRNPAQRRFNLWGYIDARDGAQAIRKSLEAPLKGAHIFIIANADTVLSRPNREVLAEFYPGTPFKREIGANETLLSIEKAGLQVPLPTLRRAPRDALRMTRGQFGLLFLLSSSLHSLLLADLPAHP